MPIPNPVAFNIFGFDIMWYAILICTGILLAALLSCKRAPLHGFTSDQILNMVIISVPAGIIGARLYYVLFHWDWYSDELLQILNTRAGGLAIHGGLIAGLGTAAIICYIRRYSALSLLDLIAPALALAQSIGRWGNYFNSEAHGGPTDLPWAVMVDGQSVHPTFLYESIWCFLLFLFLLWFDNRQLTAGSKLLKSNKNDGTDLKAKSINSSDPGIPWLFLPFDGQIFLLYAILYSLERFFVEALRTDSLMFGPFKQAQLISLTAIVIGIIAYLFLAKKQQKKESLR